MITHKSLLCVAVAGCIGSFSPVLHAMEKGEIEESIPYTRELAAKLNLPKLHSAIICGDPIDASMLTQDVINKTIELKEEWASTKIPTPLHIAAKLDRSSVIEQLINAGAKIREWDKSGDSPLVVAAIEGNIDTLKALYVHGKNFDEKNPWAIWQLCAESRLKDLYRALERLTKMQQCPHTIPENYAQNLQQCINYLEQCIKNEQVALNAVKMV